MFMNYFKTAWRNIVRHKTFAAINIFGLSTGIAACLILFIVIKYELSYNTFLPGYKSIYHVTTATTSASGTDYNPGVPKPLLDALRLEIPQVTTGALTASFGSQVTVLGKDVNSNAGKKFIEDSGVFYADPEFLKVFKYKWLAGSGDLLKDPNVTVLTQAIAEKYFGSWIDAVGQYIKLDNATDLKVVGVIENVPVNTDYPIALITSYITFKNDLIKNEDPMEWGSISSDDQVFLAVEPGQKAQVEAGLAAISKKYIKENSNKQKSFQLQPISEVHYDSRFSNWGNHVTSKATLWTLSLIGIFIVIMACINFINLSTAQAINRSKEIGIRKVLGGRRSSLFWQMMSETGLIVTGSLLIAIALAAACLPFVSHIASIEEPLQLFTPQVLLFVVLLAVIVTVLSGIYPSLILSGFKPIVALKSKITSATIGGISLRRGLVVMQFCISQVLIIGTIVAVTQMKFVNKADLGFNKEAVLVLSTSADSTVLSRQAAMKQEMLTLPAVQHIAYNSDVPSSNNNWSTNFAFDHKPDLDYNVFLKFGDEDYFKTFGMSFAAGKGFAKSDTINEVVINETLAKKLGVSAQDAVGKEIRMGSQQWRPIVGVVKDFKTNSLREDVKPMLIASRNNVYNNIAIKIKSNNLGATKDALQKVWDKHLPEYANTNFFMDENINEFYRQENQLSLLYSIFAGIAIFISCLGLYGLISFMAAQRIKEVGVRKVLGASVANILFLFSKEFTMLIIVAFAIAAPLAWYLMNDWLSSFSYRINIGIGVFVLAAVASLLIAWITVGYKSMRAALSNPVDSLRSE
ncbi:MAG: ABC transporter permease [Sphingobacteriales bacterium]|nr:MAG: ABC transporter permease [Sphingobacteriales bacterium]